MISTNAMIPSATGRLRVISGIRVPWIDLLFFAFSVVVILVPHTGQREAFSLKRVPQVGQSLVGLVSGLIGFLYQGEIIPLHPQVACQPLRSLPGM